MPTLPKEKKKPWLIKRKQKDQGSRRFDQGNKWLDIYQTKQWKATRSHHIKMNPLCVQCKEDDQRVVKGQVVDHIIPVRQGGKQFDFENLQTLCNECHNKKSIEERKTIQYTKDTMYM